ncbi:heavy metal transport/detoxification superfamily protein [Actinidia rufa]|uniref:Heavy metal transport/detoxification superfamily protein n=1 Tax=Actinidia rufa TaxID=165716 RepID=A0A7J0E1M8_9ERIC|nr:heavy metal transport/detoxification superfamily protein [Actinidia rufa]
MGALDSLSDLLRCSRRPRRSSRRFRKRKHLQTVEIMVKMDCDGCERKVRKSVAGMKGVSQVEVDRKQHKLTVTGYVDPKKVLERVRHRTGKRAEMWPYVPYDVVAHPYAPGVYDRKAPPGHVRNTEMLSDPQASGLARASSTEVKYITAFSDDNPNACSIM